MRLEWSSSAVDDLEEALDYRFLLPFDLHSALLSTGNATRRPAPQFLFRFFWSWVHDSY